MTDLMEKEKLKPMAKNPFDGKFVDLVGEDGVVTVKTITAELLDLWEMHLCGTKEFNINNLKKPAVYRDDWIYDSEDYDHQTDCYTIILPYSVMTESMVREKIDELNDLFCRNFVLDMSDYNESGEYVGKTEKENRDKVDFDEIEKENTRIRSDEEGNIIVDKFTRSGLLTNSVKVPISMVDELFEILKEVKSDE